MLLMYYEFIRGEDLPYHDNKATLILFHVYIYSRSQILIDEYPGDIVQSITRL